MIEKYRNVINNQLFTIYHNDKHKQNAWYKLIYQYMHKYQIVINKI